MPKTKISEFSSTPANNTDIDSINIAEGCAPSGINDAIRELMAQLKDFQTGAVGDSFNGPVGSTTASTGAFTTLSASSTLSVTGAGSIQGLTVGRGAGAVSTNTAVGASALAANSTGSSIVAIGDRALTSNTGNNNNALGSLAGYSNTTGTENAFLGRAAGYANTTGASNTAIGNLALNANTTASNNTAVGYQTAYSNTTGSVTAFGTQAGYSNTTGVHNTFIGGWDSTSFGSGGSTTTGGYNTALGAGSLAKNTTASNNTAVGYQAGYSNQTGGSSVYIGYQAGYTNTTSGLNVFVGYAAGNLATGNFNTFIGPASGESMTSGTKNTILGRYSGNQGGLDIRTASNYIVLSDGDGNPWFYIRASGLVTIPSLVSTYTTASSANIFVNAANGEISRSTSALKYKQDIRDLESIDIDLFRAVRYKSKCDGDNPTKDHFGVIADEVDAAGINELVTYGVDGEVEGFQYERLTVVLLKELQTLRARVAQLEQGA